MDNKKDYLQVIYNEVDRPLTDYPVKLANYLCRRFNILTGANLLEIGCGRGEFLNGFILRGVNGFGIDIIPSAGACCPCAEFRLADVEDEGIPYPDSFFDVVYSKSVIEHFYYPERMMKEVYRVLKPGGLVITLCPSWEFNYRNYFEDYTHRTPFMLESLRDIQIIQGFNNVQVEYFRQLPSTWSKFGVLAYFLSELTRFCLPSFTKKYSKWSRFSKEVMLLSSAKK
jgi:SAM-dependent methyltransferase